MSTREIKRKLYKLIPDSLYLKLYYKRAIGKKMKLNHPETFNEKLQWLKLYDRNPLYTTLVDKYAVREYIKEKIGEEYLIPLVGGPWKSVDEIPFADLPNQFVLKTTHDSGGVVICKNKESLNIDNAKEKLKKSLDRNFYYMSREWPYKNVSPQIIAERFMVDNSGTGLIDYKFFCFNGKARFLYVSQGLENHATAKISFVNMDWNFEKFKRKDYQSFQSLPNKPVKFNEMVALAERLSKDIPFLRVDLYEVEGEIYFSELTFYPCGGFIPFEPEEYDEILGNMLVLPDKKRT